MTLSAAKSTTADAFLFEGAGNIEGNGIGGGDGNDEISDNDLITDLLSGGNDDDTFRITPTANANLIDGNGGDDRDSN